MTGLHRPLQVPELVVGIDPRPKTKLDPEARRGTLLSSAPGAESYSDPGGADSIRCLVVLRLPSDRRLKWAFLIKNCPLSVVVVVVNFSHFHLLLKNHWAKFNQTLHKSSLDKRNWSLFKWRALSFSKGRLLRNCENTLTNLKSILLKDHWAIISTKVDTKHTLVKEIQVCSYEGPRPFPRGDNNEIAKIHSFDKF